MSAGADEFPPAQYAPTRRLERPTIGPEVARIALEYFGITLLPWQRWLVDLIGEQIPDPDDGFMTFAYPSVTLSVGRRSGKTTAMFLYMFARMMMESGHRSFFTAQHLASAEAAFTYDLIPMVEKSGIPQKIVRANGRQAISLGDSTMRLWAPNPLALHGSAGDLILIDEAFRHDYERGVELEVAVRPLMATREKGQFVIMSAAGNADSTWWNSLIDLGRESTVVDKGHGTAHIEWTIEGTGLDEKEPETWKTVHPGNVPTRFMREEHARSPEQFRRTILNATEREKGVDRAISVEWWDRCRAGGQPERTGEISLAFDCEPNSKSATIVACLADASHVELIESHPGVNWVVPRLLELVERYDTGPVAFDNRSPAGVLEARLDAAGVPTRHVGLGDCANAAQGFSDLVHRGEIEHWPHPVLDEAVTGARRRLLGDGGWAFSRKSSDNDVSPLIAASLAWWNHPSAHGDTAAHIY